jgi:hypothetical protein
VPLFTYEGEQELVFPSLGVTVNYGDTFEAPEGFTAANVVAATGKKATKNATATTVLEETATEPKAVENTSDKAESDALDAVATPSA